MTNTELILLCAVGAYLAVLLVIVIATLVLVLRLYRKLGAGDQAADDALIDLAVRRIECKMMDELRKEGRRELQRETMDSFASKPVDGRPTPRENPPVG